MAIYVDNLGSSSLPVELNNPQENETLVWDDASGAFINAPAPVPTEEIQDTVADMIEVDPDGSEVSLRLVSSYDDVTGKITFNVVTGTGSGAGAAGVVIKESGTTRGTATTLDFIGPSVSFASGVATITGLMSSIGIEDNGVALGDVQNLNFTNLTVTINGDTLTIDGPDLSTISNTIEVQQGGVVKGDITKLNFSGATVGVAGDTATITITGGGGAGASNLDGLTDVVLTAPSNGQVLKYNGTIWVNAPDSTGTTINSLGDIGDVDLTGLSSGLILGYNGTDWVPVPNSGATGPQGPTGATGPAGATITSAAISGSQLTLTLSDSSTVTVAGSVVGPQGSQGPTGATGATGPAGASVTSATVSVTGRLLITLSSGAVVDAGSVAGISTATVNGSGDLILTKQDSTTINAGSVIGPQGPAATVSVGTVQTMPPGSSAEVTNVGSSSAAIFNFKIPAGQTGPAFTLNSVSGSASVYGITSTTQPGYDLEVDTANKWRTPRSLSLTGKVTGLTTGIDGSGNITIATSLNNVTTDDITEGSTNKFYTDTRVRNAISSNSATGILYSPGLGSFSLSSIPNTSLASSTITINGQTISLGGSGTLTTANITENTNLYYTEARAISVANARIAASSINALADVDTVTTTPTNGQALVWNGTAWVPGTVSGGGGAVSSVNGATGTVVLTTDDVQEDGSPSNKYFTDTRARAALSSATSNSITSLIDYDSSSGIIRYRADTDYVTEGSTNLYYTNTRFDSRLGQSNISQLNDVANTTPVDGQVLTWDQTNSLWKPSTAAGVGTSIARLTFKVNYDGSGQLSSIEVLNGAGTANITNASPLAAEVEFSLIGLSAPPLSIVVYGYARQDNRYIMRHVDGSNWTLRSFAGGGSSGSPTMWDSWDPLVHILQLNLVKSNTNASAAAGQETHCVVQITGIA